MKTTDTGMWKYDEQWYKNIKVKYDNKYLNLRVVIDNKGSKIDCINHIHKKLYLWFSSNAYEVLKSSEEHIREYILEKYNIRHNNMYPSGIVLSGSKCEIQIFYYIEELDKFFDVKVVVDK